MLGGYGGGLLFGRGDESASGQVVCFPEEATGALVDCSDGSLIKEVLFHPGDGEMMSEVVFHVLAVDSVQMASGHDSGGQGLGGAEGELVYEIGLPCQDNRKEGF